jgi:hypothetical protein
MVEVLPELFVALITMVMGTPSSGGEMAPPIIILVILLPTLLSTLTPARSSTGLHVSPVVVGAGVVVTGGGSELVAWAWAGRIMLFITGLLHLAVSAIVPATAVPAAIVFNAFLRDLLSGLSWFFPI